MVVGEAIYPLVSVFTPLISAGRTGEPVFKAAAHPASSALPLPSRFWFTVSAEEADSGPKQVMMDFYSMLWLRGATFYLKTAKDSEGARVLALEVHRDKGAVPDDRVCAVAGAQLHAFEQRTGRSLRSLWIEWRDEVKPAEISEIAEPI